MARNNMTESSRRDDSSKMLLAAQAPTPYSRMCYRDASAIPFCLYHLQVVHLKEVTLRLGQGALY